PGVAVPLAARALSATWAFSLARGDLFRVGDGRGAVPARPPRARPAGGSWLARADVRVGAAGRGHAAGVGLALASDRACGGVHARARDQRVGAACRAVGRADRERER